MTHLTKEDHRTVRQLFRKGRLRPGMALMTTPDSLILVPCGSRSVH